MAVFHSLEIYLKSLKANRLWLSIAIRYLEDVDSYRKSKFGLWDRLIRTENEINYMISGMPSLLRSGFQQNVLATDFVTIDTWAPRVTKSLLEDPQTWTSLAVDVDIGGTTSSLTIAQDVSVAIFDVFDVGDVVEITQAENPGHNGFHTVSVRTSSPNVLTFNSTMGGSNNADDTSMVIELIER